MIRAIHFSGILYGLTISVLISSLPSFAQVETFTVSAQNIPTNSANTTQ